MSAIKTFCVAHKPLMFPVPDDVTVIWLGAAPPPSGGPHTIWRAGDVADEFEVWHNFLGGSAGTFAIEKLLRDRVIPWEPQDRVSITHYRKFLSTQPRGIPSYYPSLYLAKLEDVADMDLHQIQGEISADFFVPGPFQMDLPIFLQYAQGHESADLLRYLAIAIELGIINPAELNSLLQRTLLLPGGIDLGIYPIPFFLDISEKLRRICMRFLELHRPVSLTSYQRRALSFCNERLGSYIILEHLSVHYPSGVPEGIYGYINNVGENYDYTPGLA